MTDRRGGYQDGYNEGRRDGMADMRERCEEWHKADRRDALRYRWLKENHLQLGPDCWIRTGDDLDEAIDAELDRDDSRQEQ